jgi:predicted  nucleic acid-binding Zn-ribbon protein
MIPDIEHLMALQRLDTAMHDAQYRLADEPARLQALDARLDTAKAAVASAKEHLAANQAARREVDKELALHQGRLSKFREQAMAVKTNQEYHAIQHEIAFAQEQIKTHEDRMLERMLEADEFNAAIKAAEAELAATQKAVDADRKAIGAEHDQLRARVDALTQERATLVGQLSRDALATFELVSKRRNGIAMAEARDGICTICHVRLRPQVFNTVRRNDAIIQCDSCNRILYFVPSVAPAAGAQEPAPSA